MDQDSSPQASSACLRACQRLEQAPRGVRQYGRRAGLVKSVSETKKNAILFYLYLIAKEAEYRIQYRAERQNTEGGAEHGHI